VPENAVTQFQLSTICHLKDNPHNVIAIFDSDITPDIDLKATKFVFLYTHDVQ